jgi:hypothetical protein
MNRCGLDVSGFSLFRSLLCQQDIAQRLEGPGPLLTQNRQMSCSLFERFRSLVPLSESLVGASDSEPDFAALRSVGALGNGLDVLFQLFLKGGKFRPALGPQGKTCGKETGQDELGGPAARVNAAQEVVEREREKERETSARSPAGRLF